MLSAATTGRRILHQVVVSYLLSFARLAVGSARCSCGERGRLMNIELAIRQFRKTGQAGVYEQIVKELECRIPRLLAMARPALSPECRNILNECGEPGLVSRLLEKVVGFPGKKVAYKPLSKKFDGYAVKHIQLFVREQVSKNKKCPESRFKKHSSKWIPLDEAPEPPTPPNRVPTNTLPMDKIHGVLEKPLMAALNSVKICPKTKILYVIDQLNPNEVSTTIYDALCREARLSAVSKAKIIQLTSKKPDNYARQVEQILDISQSAACRRVERAVPHLLDPLQDVMIAARKDLEPLRNPPPHTNGDPFFADD